MPKQNIARLLFIYLCKTDINCIAGEFLYVDGQIE